ncbi:uncharacterized protein LOC127281426 isoform X2 [Leptopilina boulardi]|uniref:uncharacterized protein LOC127281426 isoform X2 n=1 Tax=Leptopilina boulardi TaxID=63433 RepID=UPI0021F60009|nr:uncharacterized protein LOC127281426 isoform X2 [Leptopilina boulardi]
MAEKVNSLLTVTQIPNLPKNPQIQKFEKLSNFTKIEEQQQNNQRVNKNLSQCEKQRRKAKVYKKRRSREKMIDLEKLPTPPPDPMETNVFDEAFVKHKENENLKKEFLDYLRNRRPSSESNSGSIFRSASSFAANFDGTEEAFDHLEKLFLLMEQVINLRDRNSKMFRRLRELERIKALRNADREVERALLNGEDVALPEEDVGFAESLLGAILSSGPDMMMTAKKNFRSPPIMRQRSRSIGIENPAMRLSQMNPSSSGGGLSHNNKKRMSVVGAPKVSKWTKVKAAFKWEKAGTVDSIDPEIMRFLKVPDNNDTSTGSGFSPRTGDHSGPPSPSTLSSSSSTDEVFQGINKRPRSGQLPVRTKEDITNDDSSRRSRSLDGDVLIPQNIAYSNHLFKGNTNVRKFDKGQSRTPWGKVKNMIHLRRENIRRQPPRGSIRSEDGYSISSLESSEILQELLQFEYGKARVQITTSECPTVNSSKPSSPGSEIVDLASRRLTPTLTITVPSSEELRSISSPESISPPPSHHLDSAEERSPSDEFEFLKNTPLVIGRSKTWQDVPSSLEFKRQYSQKGDSSNISRLQRQDSKWHKVKRAFLTNTASVPPSPSRVSSFFDEADIGGSYSASAEDLETDASSNVQAEIQRNYQLLHDKLSAEFYRKLSEWEKLKSTSPTGLTQLNLHHQENNNSRCKLVRDKDSSNALLIGEGQLTPEFKKKLDEWKRIKKGNSAGTTTPEQQIFKRRLTDWQIWRASAKSESKTDSEPSKPPHLSEEFLKKLEEWKKIKSARNDDEHDGGKKDSNSSKSFRNSKVWKTLDEKEFQPLEKLLGKIEKVQPKLQKRRNKILDREARLSMLKRNAGVSSPRKKEVLVHTSTGFFRFEGISQEFTRKLYEWEKSQGISPESSTFRFLNPAYRISADATPTESQHEKGMRPILKRSKSVGSIVGSTREETPIRQLSSLSLNDVEELDAQAKRVNSEQTIAEEEVSEEITMDDSEPEAIIVDIEDVIEETASPMAKLQPHQTPVYCVAASETTSIAIPLGTVTSSHEPSPVILFEAGELHPITARLVVKNQILSSHSSIVSVIQESYTNPLAFSEELTDARKEEPVVFNEVKRSKTILRDINNKNDGKNKRTKSKLDRHIDKQKFCSSIYGISEQKQIHSLVQDDCSNRKQKDSETKAYYENKRQRDFRDIPQTAEFNTIVDTCLESSQVLEVSPTKDYVNAILVTSLSEPNSDKESFKKMEIPNKREKTKKSENFFDERENEAKSLTIIVNDLASGTKAFENACRKCSLEEEDVVITVNRDIRPKKVLKTRRLTDTQVGYQWISKIPNEIDSPIESSPLTVSAFQETPNVERIIINESTLNKIVVPTASSTEPIVQESNLHENTSERNCLDLGEEEEEAAAPTCKREKQESQSVFVKTKRIIFSPFRRNSKEKGCEISKEVQKDDNEDSNEFPIKAMKSNQSTSTSDAQIAIQPWANLHRTRSNSESPCSRERRRIIDSNEQRRPPLPQSPILSRKEYRRSSPKETAPSIRMMIQRYNQKLEDAGSPASSGSGSPIWRSPVTERRVRTQMEKYQEEVRKAIAGPPRRDVLKSASTSLIRDNSTGSPLNSPISERSRKTEILKSTSADFTRNHLYSTVHNIKIDEEKDSKKINNPNESLTKNEKSRENISPDLIHKLEALSSAAAQNNRNSLPSSSSTKHSMQSLTTNILDDSQAEESDDSSSLLKIRAQRLQKAKEDFLSRGPSCYSHDPSIDSRQDEIVFDSGTESVDYEDRPDLIKSASAGMINVDPDTFERLATNRGCESLPRSVKKINNTPNRFSQIANKFRRTKLKKAKEKESKMSTVSMLCRQSLLVDIQLEGASKSCPTSPSPQREDDDTNRFKKHRESN